MDLVSQIFKKLYKNDKTVALAHIEKVRRAQGFAIIHFAYFASLYMQGLFKKAALNQEYFEELLQADFLMPDWIALQIYAKKHFWDQLSNLNWTDFLPFYLETRKPNSYLIHLYGAFPHVLEKTVEKLESKYGKSSIGYVQDGYSTFDETLFKEKIDEDKENIFLIAQWSPRQELWVYNNRDMISNFRLTLFSVWGLFDFWAGLEKRAPIIIRKLRGEFVRRFLTHPKKNAKKFLTSWIVFWYLLK